MLIKLSHWFIYCLLLSFCYEWNGFIMRSNKNLFPVYFLPNPLIIIRVKNCLSTNRKCSLEFILTRSVVMDLVHLPTLKDIFFAVGVPKLWINTWGSSRTHLKVSPLKHSYYYYYFTLSIREHLPIIFTTPSVVVLLHLILLQNL